MGNRQRIGIFLVIGIFIVSTLGIAIAGLSGGNSASTTETAEELAAQAEQLRLQQEAQALFAEQQAACPSTPRVATTPREVPKFELPGGDVTELTTVDLTVGTGAEVQPGDCIEAYYHGVLADGTVFDSAFEDGDTSTFSLNGVITGWGEGIPGMKEGGVRVLTIPSELGYGERGSPPLIGANADLVFVVELVKVVEN